MRLLAAMSGGVDSSVAAALAARDGHDVTGVTLKQWDDPSEAARLTKGCSVVDAVADARRAADTLGIPHYTLDMREVFAREVILPFVADYAAGLTPNPCVRCNELVRFGALLARALRLGFDGLVTGHYARTSDGRLYRAVDRMKDQSYMLYAVSRAALQKALWPVGELASKTHVRTLARSLGLPVADREESVDVCFVPEGSSSGDLVAERAPLAVRRGPIVDEAGHVVGEHRGLAYYTVGQRRGLGALGQRTYVSSIDIRSNKIVVGGPDDLLVSALTASRARWLRAPTSGDEIEAVVRYAGTPAACVVRELTDERFALSFESPVRAVAPGQAVVLYDGDEVLGGGTITRAERSA